MRIWRAIRPFEELRARHDAGNNVPAVKEAMEIAGVIPHATVRPPLAPLSPVDRAELADRHARARTRLVTAVLVTGAAGGLGSALVSALLARGDRVVAHRPRADRAATMSLRTRSISPTRTPSPAALADAAGRGLADPARRGDRGRLRCRRRRRGADLADLPLAVFRASLELNLVTAWITLRAALPHLRRATAIARSR